MGSLVRVLCAFFACCTCATALHAQSNTLEVTATYRERIALPPDAQLEVQLLDVSRADAAAIRVASQRFAMTSVPATVALAYDPNVIDDQASYAVSASIWTGGEERFKTTSFFPAFSETEAEPLEVLLSIVIATDDPSQPPSISGVRWVATEVWGEPWSNDDPATLVVDNEMNASIFGGCNRFVGQLYFAGRELAFPASFAGTLMACPADIEAQERVFLDALAQVTSYVRYGAGLVLTDKSGNALVHFVDRAE